MAAQSIKLAPRPPSVGQVSYICRVRFSGSLGLEQSHYSRTLNRLFSWEWPHLPGVTGVRLVIQELALPNY
jgi:hypothetical protein